MNKIWLEHYQSGVPAEINPNAYSSLVELFNQCCEKYAENPALGNLGCRLTYRDLHKSSQAFAAYLQQELNFKKGDRFAIMLPNMLQYPVVLFGALMAGLIVVNVNPLYTATELLHQLTNAEAQGILVLANFAHVVQAVLPKTSLKHVIVTELGDLFPWPKSVMANFIVKHIKKMVPPWSIASAIPFKAALKKGRTLNFTPVAVDGEDIAFLQYTGGTTGVAKGAILTHRNMVANIEQVLAFTKPVLTGSDEIIITPLPLYHIFSLTANCLAFICFGAYNVLITNPRDIPNLIEELSKVKFTVLTGVNTLFNALLNNTKFAKLDFSNLKIALAGGASLQRSVAERWKNITGTPLLEGYGLTETSPVVCITPMNTKEYNGSVGLPVPSTDIMLRDEDGKEVPFGERGELCIKGPQVMQGYWHNPEETKKAFTEEGWLLTGDIARVDDKGFVYIVERKKDMILVSGFNVYPNEVEDVIASMPGVLEVAVIGVPDQHSGEAAKAFIVKKDPALTEQDVINFAREKLTGYKLPKKIEFRDSLPKTPVGKILRRTLREEENKK